MNAQQIVNKACEHFAEQKVQSTNSAGECMYRGDKGRKCVAGAFIKDCDYKKEMEGTGVHSERVWPKLGLVDKHRNLLEDLQVAHDESFDSEYLKQRLTRICNERYLDPSKIELITEWGKGGGGE